MEEGGGLRSSVTSAPCEPPGLKRSLRPWGKTTEVRYRGFHRLETVRFRGRGQIRGGHVTGSVSQRLKPRTIPHKELRSAADMTADLTVSLSLLAGIVALSEATRRLLNRILTGTGLSLYAVELVSTFQLCCCTHELKLLSEVGGIEPRVALTLTYLAAVVHGLTFSGAIGNPCGALEHAYRTRTSGWCALRRIACQFAAAAAARAAVALIWGMGLSGLHVRHKLLGYRCISSIHAPLPKAATVELACAFAVQTAITHTRSMEEKYRVHAVAAVITSSVYAGMKVF